MKTFMLSLAITMVSLCGFAQWVQVNNGLPDFQPTAMYAVGDTMLVSTFGGGIYKSYDNGENWINLSGNLGNLYVNDIRGFASNLSMMVATDGGPFMTLDQSDYVNCTSTGLGSTEVNYFWWGDENMGGDFMVGTKGAGVFASEDYTGPWTAANTNVNGDGLYVNDLGGYSDDDVEYSVMATDGGTYWAIDGATEWTQKNGGLTGEALKVKKLTGVASLVLIATHGGLYYNYGLVDEWTPLIPGEKLNIIFVHTSPVSPTGFMIFAFGEHGFYSEDFLSWASLDLGSIQGEITTAGANSTDIFVGVSGAATSDSRSNGIYRAPLDQLVTGIHELDKAISDLTVSQNYPNPFSESTSISFNVISPGIVYLQIFDIKGTLVFQQVKNVTQVGMDQFEIGKGSIQPGIYFYSLQKDGILSNTMSMIVTQ